MTDLVKLAIASLERSKSSYLKFRFVAYKSNSDLMDRCYSSRIIIILLFKVYIFLEIS